MEEGISRKTSVSKEEITTIKLSKGTKERLDHLRIHPRETYEEIMQRMLEILNVCRADPERARFRLLSLEKQKKSFGK